MQTEKQFENKVKKFLKEQGAWFIKYNPEFFGAKGTPDILACCNGYFLGIEVKRETGKPSELQLKKIEQIRQAGGIAMVLKPSGFENFKKIVEGLYEKSGR